MPILVCLYTGQVVYTMKMDYELKQISALLVTEETADTLEINTMLQNRNQMDTSGTEPLYRFAVGILLKYKMNEFTDTVFLLASVIICENKLNILFEDKDVSLRQLISLLQKEIEKEAVSLSEHYTEGLSKINQRGFMRLIRYAIDNPMYPDQIACGPLIFSLVYW